MRFLKYGNPDSCFWQKNDFFQNISFIWVKGMQNLIFSFQFQILLHGNPGTKFFGWKKFKKNYGVKLTKISFWTYGLMDFSHSWIQMPFFPWFQTQCKISLFPWLFLSYSWFFLCQRGLYIIKIFQLLHSLKENHLNPF